MAYAAANHTPDRDGSAGILPAAVQQLAFTQGLRQMQPGFSSAMAQSPANPCQGGGYSPRPGHMQSIIIILVNMTGSIQTLF